MLKAHQQERVRATPLVEVSVVLAARARFAASALAACAPFRPETLATSGSEHRLGSFLNQYHSPQHEYIGDTALIANGDRERCSCDESSVRRWRVDAGIKTSENVPHGQFRCSSRYKNNHWPPRTCNLGLR